MRPFKADSLRWSVGLFGALLGTMMLVAPQQFSSLICAALRPALGFPGALFLLTGIGLIFVVVIRPPRPLAVLTHLLVGAEFLGLAYILALGSGWTGTSIYGVLGVGTALAPFVASQPNPRSPTMTRDLLPFSVVARGG
jgi:hypothetical protein